MSRQMTLLAVLGAVLLVVVGYLFLIKPQQDEISEIRAEVDSTQEQQQQVEAQIAQLESVRARIPEVEAAIAAAETILPRDDAQLASAVRQLQMAANDSGVTLSSVTMSRPSAVTDAQADVPENLASIGVSVALEGGYFQIVDFLRRVENPVLSPRAILWSTSSVSLSEYPTLTANLAGSMYAYLEDPGVPVPEPTEDETSDESDTETEVDVDVEVVETEEAA